MENSRSSGSGALLLFLLFLTLKLTGVIHWSWWLVTLPLWGGFALALLIFGIGFLIFLTVGRKVTR